MAKMIQIRHVPDALHKRLKTRAAYAGMTLSDYLRGELEAIAAQMTDDEFRLKLRELHEELGAVQLDEPPEVTIRRMRGPLRSG